jgi:hypothetical protein
MVPGTLRTGDGSPVTSSSGTAVGLPGSPVPAPAAKPAAAPTATAGTPPPPAVKAESVGFQNEELSRIISLVHHR